MKTGQGGGGLGDPLERDPKLVLEDVIDDWVSLERARKDYGVVIVAIDPEILEYEIDYEATKKKRAYIQDNRVKWPKEDPEIVMKKYLKGDIDMLDVVRRYGVVIDQVENQLLPNSTRQYRDLLKLKMTPYWRKPFPRLK
jgi:N-methylhydantoinase B